MSQRKFKVGVVGATGMVGKTFMQLLNERNFPLAELRPFASENSLGKSIEVLGHSWPVQVLKPNCFDGLDIVFFSSGDDISKEWAPLAAKAGAMAIDNSAAFRMDETKILSVPEVNGHLLSSDMNPQVIANPNCSTIQLVVALKPLQKKFGINEVRVATYQSVSGAGQAGYDELVSQTHVHVQTEAKASHQPAAFPHQILFNVIPQIGSFNDDGFCSEEVKIMKETKKILEQPDLKVSAFTVRVPVLVAHSEAVWVTLNKEVSRHEIIEALEAQEGLVVIDDPKTSQYPLPHAIAGKDPVYVGRIHQDIENKKMWLMWVVSDNVKKGAALNGLQIAEKIIFQNQKHY